MEQICELTLDRVENNKGIAKETDILRRRLRKTEDNEKSWCLTKKKRTFDDTLEISEKSAEVARQPRRQP